MADSRCFVQLSHPGREHERDHGPHKAWNRMDYGHARKFMLLHGEWIEEDGARQAGDLHAWGEWEAESELVSTLNPPAGDWLHPRYLWRPYYVPKSSYEGLHNTDPFIFGQRFLYSNCGQPKRPGLRQLDRRSVIAFGSSKKVRGEWRWMLDTVLVVRDFKDYPWSDARNALRDWAPSTFLDVTISPLTGDAGQSTPASCAPTPTGCTPTIPTEGATTDDLLRLYRGATPDDPVDGMFSFFPASPAGGDSGFTRPFIELPADYLNPKSAQSPKGLRRNRTPDELRGLWGQLVEQVRDAGLVLGAHAELPERR